MSSEELQSLNLWVKPDVRAGVDAEQKKLQQELGMKVSKGAVVNRIYAQWLDYKKKERQEMVSKLSYAELKAACYKLFDAPFPWEVVLLKSATDDDRAMLALLWNAFAGEVGNAPDIPDDLRKALA